MNDIHQHFFHIKKLVSWVKYRSSNVMASCLAVRFASLMNWSISMKDCRTSWNRYSVYLFYVWMQASGRYIFMFFVWAFIGSGFIFVHLSYSLLSTNLERKSMIRGQGKFSITSKLIKVQMLSIEHPNHRTH